AEFLLFNFEAPTASVAEINNKIRLEQGTVLRYLLIKTKPLKVRKVRDVRKVQEGKSTEERKEEVNPPADGEVKPKVTVTTRPPSSGKAGLRRASPPATKAVASKKVAKPVESKSIKGTKGSKSIKGKSKR
ncbi:hypothetical protein HYW40_00735, partial [Candidatus Curtissbacteria bacterium]|nr:hypothetical protein [Candidatus Curtissbacteria bacterium]